jgi:predicted NBD/HSP70 family sugar kinase
MAPNWIGADIRRLFEAEFDSPIFADNDGNCAAIAEMTWGAAAGFDDFVFMKIDSGVGGAVIVNRKVITGKAGGAGEFGHMPIDPQGDLCACGNRGCLELRASLGSVKKFAERRFGSAIEVDEIIELAKEGDIGCRRLLADAGEAAGQGLALVGAVLNPSLIVIGGRGVAAGEYLLASLRTSYTKHILADQWPEEIRAPIVTGAFPQDDSVLGAVCLVLRHHGRLGAPTEAARVD